MKKEEKTKRTYEKILHAAIEEFGTNSYASGSLTTICNKHQISKGLLYHNFKGKDDLYLQCVKVCFQEMTAYLQQCDLKDGTIQGSMQKLLHERQKFFKENPYYGNIFFNTVLQPPVHLRGEIHEIRQEFDSYFTGCYQGLLEKLTLRKGITPEAAAEYFMIFQEMFNGYFQCKSYEKSDFHTLIQDHELNLSRILDIILYGIAEKTTEHHGEKTENSNI